MWGCSENVAYLSTPQIISSINTQQEVIMSSLLQCCCSVLSHLSKPTPVLFITQTIVAVSSWVFWVFTSTIKSVWSVGVYSWQRTCLEMSDSVTWRQFLFYPILVSISSYNEKKNQPRQTLMCLFPFMILTLRSSRQAYSCWSVCFNPPAKKRSSCVSGSSLVIGVGSYHCYTHLESASHSKGCV